MFTVPLFVQFLPRPLPTPVRSVASVVTPLVVSVPVPVMSAPLFHAKLPFSVRFPAPLSVTVSPPVSANGLPSARFAFTFTTPALIVTLPLPVTLVPAFRLCVPPANCSPAPPLTLNAPLWVPPVLSSSVPAFTFTPPPALLNATLKSLVPLELLVSVPVLPKLEAVLPPLTTLWLLPIVKVPLLAKLAPVFRLISLAPDQLSAPALVKLRLESVTCAAPAMLPVPSALSVVLPVPLIVPPDQARLPLTVAAPLPFKVPAFRFRFTLLNVPSTCTVPPFTFTLPVLVKLCPAFTISVPPPTFSAPLRLPPAASVSVPARRLPVPLWVNPPCNSTPLPPALIAPPRLLNTIPLAKLVAAPPVLFNSPALVNVPPPPPLAIVCALVTVNVAPAALFNTAPPPSVMPLAADQVSAPWLLNVRCVRVATPVAAMLPVLPASSAV